MTRTETQLSGTHWDFLCNWHRSFGSQFCDYWLLFPDLSKEELDKRYEIMELLNQVDDKLEEFRKAAIEKYLEEEDEEYEYAQG